MYLGFSEAVSQSCSVKKVFLEISQNSKGKQLFQRLFFNKVAGLMHQVLWRFDQFSRSYEVTKST